MLKVQEICDFLFEKAPYALKLDFDNVGLLAGFADAEVRSVLVALDITDGVIAEAEKLGAELIVSHHPLIFEARKSVSDTDATGRKLVRIISGGRSAICMHTNLDAAPGGVNDTLAEALGAEVKGVLNTVEGVSRIAELNEALELNQFLARVKSALGADGLRYVDAGRRVKKLGLCGGAGGGDITLAARAGCDTYLTADVKHHQFLEAQELGINLIDAGHFSTENVIVPIIAKWLSEHFPDLKVETSKTHHQPERFYV